MEPPLKVLLVHNHYGSQEPSGENIVFELERRLLEERGHEVRAFERHSDEIRAQGWLGLARGAAATAWNPLAARRIRRLIRDFAPDVVHAHNTFPLISPAIFSAIEAPAARVLTLHNYRLFCAAGAPVREGKVCTECLDRSSVLPAIRHGCYRGGRLSTVPLAAGVALHRRLGTWDRHVDAFIALTEFQRRTMEEAGLPAGRVHVKPNFYPGQPAVVPWASRQDRVVFAGRMTEEKGIRDLIQAWLAWGAEAPVLVVAGDGPLRPEMEERVREAGATNVRLLGMVPEEEAHALIAHSRLVVVPSTWFEGFPMVLREALALGTPALVSAVGALPDLVRPADAGDTFAPGDPDSLLAAARALWADPPVLERMAGHARREFQDKYTEEANYRRLLEVYERARLERTCAVRTPADASSPSGV